MTARVGLVGAAGHGTWHLRAIAELQAAGELRLVGVCDVAAVSVPPGVAFFHDHEDLLRATRPDIVVVCTPPHTHLAIATAAARAGADVLLEKPPVVDLAEHDALAAELDRAGRVGQVGFQALGSAALDRLRAAIAAGDLGSVTGIGARGAWFRPDGYFRRAAWVGRRTLDGRRVVDGALVNPFAHAVMQVLAIADPPVSTGASTVEVELYRARDIEADDTACLRLRFDAAEPFDAVIAVTLCAEEFVAGDITVTGTVGTAVLEYPTDRLRLPGEAEPTEVPGRAGLLANLIAHRRDPATPLLVPLDRTRAFTGLLAPILEARVSTVDPEFRRRHDDRIAIAGVNRAVDAAASRRRLFSELTDPPVAWTRPRREEQP